MSKIQQAKEWYEERERHVSTAFLVGGFIFDSITLKRIDSLIDNVWIATNLLLVCICIVLINRGENAGENNGSWKNFWLFNVMQFSFGALLGASFIFYFRSATLAISWPFLAILLAAILANEYFQKRYARLTFQISFLYLSVFIFAIFLLPVVLHSIGPFIFILSGVVSLLFVWGFMNVLRMFAKEKFKQSLMPIWQSVTVIFLTLNILYFTNLIPPIPLSLKDAGIYHAISRDAEGNYLVTEEKKGWGRFFTLGENIHWVPGTPLYAYTAVFSPGSLNTQVVHEWQYKDEAGKWVTATRIPLYLSGGRSDGFRIFSVKYNLTPGEWRINVATPRGQVLGRINFEIVSVTSTPALNTSVK